MEKNCNFQSCYRPCRAINLLLRSPDHLSPWLSLLQLAKIGKKYKKILKSTSHSCIFSVAPFLEVFFMIFPYFFCGFQRAHCAARELSRHFSPTVISLMATRGRRRAVQTPALLLFKKIYYIHIFHEPEVYFSLKTIKKYEEKKNGLSAKSPSIF